jgi:purine-binding chemotaxis protein CheW
MNEAEAHAKARRDISAILQQRARALAEPEVEEADDAEAFATFTVGGHAIGVPLLHVLRASDLRHLTEIPEGPPWLVGVTAIEGHLVSLLDLARFLGLPRAGVADVRGSLVVAAGKREIGLVAEQLLGIADLPPSSVMALPGADGPLRRVARAQGPGGGDLLLLDVEALFDDPRLGARRG